MKWVTSEGLTPDAAACLWLVTRYIDPRPDVVLVPAGAVMATARAEQAIPFNVPGAKLGGAGHLCCFEAFLKHHRLYDPALRRLAFIVAAATTGRKLTREGEGLRALFQGLAIVGSDDREVLRRGMTVYDGLHAWCREKTRHGQRKDKPMMCEIKPLSCDATGIAGMSERLILSHYENNYGGAVKRLNAIRQQLADLDFAATPGFVLNGLKREELIAANSMVLHELFFDCLGSGGDPDPALANQFGRDFGGIDRWRAEFSAMGKALAGGSGWVLLTYSIREGRLVNQWAADHAHVMADGRPILALDMYEHSYHLDYGAKAAAYVDAFMAAINWAAVSHRFAEAVRR